MVNFIPFQKGRSIVENLMRKGLFGVFLFGLILTAFGGLAFAQEEPVEEQPGIEEETMEVPIVLGEITVTAQKREEDIQDVPVSVSTLRGEDLAIITTGGVDVRALSARVPSLIMESSFGRAFPRFYIRGLGNTDFDLNASQPVSMVVDEVVLENPVVKGMPLFDLDRVEVLRGPQGTLFGRNTPAGIVKFETVRPSQEFDAFVRASYGTYSTTDIQAAVGGSLGGGFSARASGLYQSRGNWVNNNYPGGEDLGGYTTTAFRLQLQWEPNDKFSGLFKVHGWEVSDGTARIFRANIIKHGTSNLVDGFQQDQATLNGLNTQEITSRGGLLRLSYDFGAATLTSITGYESIRDMYSRGDIDGGGFAGPGFIPFQSESAGAMPSLDQWTQEFRLASNGGGAVNWLAGFFYFNEEVNIDNFSYDTYSPGNPQNALATQFQETKAFALFGSLNWAVSDTWDLAGGLRYTDDDKDFWVAMPQSLPWIPDLDGRITEQVGDSFVSWDLSATFKASQDVNVYGRLATGFRAPSIQGRITFCPVPEECVTTADTEQNTSFEIGVKSILAQNKLRLNLTAYIFEMSDQQLTAVGGEFNSATLLNADKTTGHGLEADIEWIPSGNWMMTFGASWNPTEIVDADLTVAPCGGGCTVTDPINDDGLALINGNSLPHAPEYIFNGIINFRSDPVKKSFFGSLDFAYHSEKHFFLYDSVEFNSSAFELGMRLGYAWNNTSYEVALFGRNLLDAEIVRNGIDFNNLTGMMNDPRIIGVEFLARF
jgi:iron complex outermembrane receptor protein